MMLKQLASSHAAGCRKISSGHSSNTQSSAQRKDLTPSKPRRRRRRRILHYTSVKPTRPPLLSTVFTMAPLTTLARAAVRSSAAASLPVRALSTSAACSVAASGTTSPSYSSPFKGAQKSTQVPDFSHYMAKSSGSTNQLFGYFMVGTLGAISAAGAKSTIQGELPYHLSRRGRL